MPPRASTGQSPLTQQEAILQAIASNDLGLFRIRLSQIEAHPFQRALDNEWVVQLKDHLVEHGLDKAAHPVKVLLHGEESTSLATSVDTLSDGQSSEGQWVREDLRFLVFDGQHRLAACAAMNTEAEKWWFGRVYRKALEDDHPAEFLSLIHAGNEAEVRREAHDADRFLGVYRLHKLLAAERITQTTLEVNKHRLMGTVSSTRRGISTLTKSMVLSQAVAEVIQPLHLRSGFNAGTWRKLGVGRFYQLVAWILQEMAVQCNLLLGNTTEVTSAPFLLSARQCRWDSLEQAIRSKSHAWHKLDGGASAALERVKKVPDQPRVRLANASGRSWTFGEVVLLPTVLTSQTVLQPLGEMYQIAQHLVHIIAGRPGLDEYTSPSGQLHDDSHPVGFIYRTLGDRARNSDGTLKDYPHKVIFHMWTQREGLSSELHQCEIEEAMDTTPEQYQTLIDQKEAWWTLLRLFKMDRFPAGLGVIVSKDNGTQASSRAPEVVQPRRSSSTIAPNPPLPTPQVGVRTLSSGSMATSENGETACSAGAGGLVPDAQESLPQYTPSLASITPHGQQHKGTLPPPTERSSRKRPRESSPEDDLEVWLHQSAKEIRTLQEELGETPPEAGHRRLNHQIHLLAERSRSLGRSDAAAVALLMESLHDVQSPLLGRVTERLRQHIPKFKARAEREIMAVYHDDVDGVEGKSQVGDEGESESEGRWGDKEVDQREEEEEEEGGDRDGEGHDRDDEGEGDEEAMGND